MIEILFPFSRSGYQWKLPKLNLVKWKIENCEGMHTTENRYFFEFKLRIGKYVLCAQIRNLGRTNVWYSGYLSGTSNFCDRHRLGTLRQLEPGPSRRRLPPMRTTGPVAIGQRPAGGLYFLSSQFGFNVGVIAQHKKTITRLFLCKHALVEDLGPNPPSLARAITIETQVDTTVTT